MKKIAIIVLGALSVMSLRAQETPAKKEPINLSGRANDHFMVQLGYTGWAGKPDSIVTGGFSKSFNVYFMFDFPFKSNPKLSMAFGPGISSDGIKFKKTYIGIKETTATMPFVNQANSNHFKKTKLTTAYLEAPVEFRYTARPLESGKSLKMAIGVKVGTMINAHTRYKTLQNSSGATVNDYLLKESSKKFFNTTRLSGMARVGLGHFSIYGSYQITSVFKEGVAPDVRPYSIGLTLSGL